MTLRYKYFLIFYMHVSNVFSKCVNMYSTFDILHIFAFVYILVQFYIFTLVIYKHPQYNRIPPNCRQLKLQTLSSANNFEHGSMVNSVLSEILYHGRRPSSGIIKRNW